ncbi:MAG: flagellar hook assembly protein FlgD [Gammaproteobacteria bacterium]|uniref:flagellar hook assembly protein FlgD n=1 Tax=Rhodoferax sp. TaxID=50421 RepID=UPI0017D68FAE|nr:flagellar hook capping FlgD N-terminal domain-containing protein [Rhodoferax sp.]MBU3899281.1 flagellar hook assembly protein FlgD [Gammaproteobacteria bacterium]MBA3058162.1 flagellar hook assembly protein FlgD [Rhodoferax sp.]MBU3996917.1 flagellar hook assembly protein FlgD [Gammaproteobacteria bacterium]MBU4081257.1 flagellar hook assembly protein FlgD [Gammaproteobacteria bacterium]MBU4115268.1 flagellar hook assembly protein FlgD [Gammaproteobacteria bacterium]
MLSATSSLTSTAAASSNTTASGASTATSEADVSQDRFLKLLVAQLNNQDPMNPMDNAQMTSQMAQINTVTGIQQVNETLKSMAQQFTSLQVLQGASMVGHGVLVESNTLTRSGGVASGAVDLDGKADSVKVEILSPGGQLLDTLNLGALAAGRHSFDWNASSYQGSGEPSYKVTATLGGQPIGTTALARDTVTSVGSDNGAMSLQLQGRSAVAYSSIKAIL